MDTSAIVSRNLLILPLTAALGLGLLHGIAMCAEPEAELTIGIRREQTPPTTETKPAESVIPARLTESAALREAEKIAQRLVKLKSTDPGTTDLAAALKREPERYGILFAKLLDPAKFKDASTRLGALRALQVAAPASPAVGKSLADSVIAEPVAEVRTAALDILRQRTDHTAGAELLRYWRSAYDEDNGFNEKARASAVAAMRDIGDRKVFEALLYYVTLEVRAEAATNPRVDTVSIRGQGINLPIDLPSTNAMSFHATLVVPALASLQQATGENFGRNIDKWNEWLQKQPEFMK